MKVTFVLLAAMLPTAALANTDADAQIWTNFSATGSLSGPIMGNTELSVRGSNDQGRIYETQMTGQLGYKVSKAVTVWVGYRRVVGYRDNQRASRENRIRQQININLGTLAGGKLTARSGLEWRTREGSDGTGVRARQQFKWAIPIKKGGKTDFVLAHEDFVSLNSTSWGQQGGYNRMRNFIGINTPITKGVRAEIGYQNQWDIRRGTFDRVFHIGLVTLAYSF
jgi:hypothetical protein